MKEFMYNKYVSFEKIQEYDDRIDNDPLMDVNLARDPIIREICRAGQYLADHLSELNCPDHIIGRILYTAGGLCFGRKYPWQVHHDILQRFVDGTLEFEPEPDILLN